MKRTGAQPSAPAPDPAATGYGGSSPFRLAREEPLATRLLPITAELPHYRVPSARRDLIAGVTVAALAIPSAMAYAEVAGLSPINGLYALLLPVIAYVISMVLTAAYGRRHFPLPFPTGDFARVLLGSVAMALVLLVLRDHRGPFALAAQVIAGAAVYGAMLLCANFLDSRRFLSHRLGRRTNGAAAATVVTNAAPVAAAAR